MPTNLYTGLKVRGCTAPNGERYIAIKQHGQECLVRYHAMLTDPAATFDDLAQQGHPIAGRAFVAEVLEQVRETASFPAEEVLQYAGWNGPLYARPDGKVLVPAAAAEGGLAPSIGFYRHPSRNRRAGSRADWTGKIAPVLLGDDLLATLVGLALAPVVRGLLSRPIGPIACQFVTDQCRAVRRVALSVVGSMAADSLATDPVGQVASNPQRYVDASRDGLLVLGDIAGYLCGGTDRKRTAAIRSLLFDHLLPTDGGNSNAAGLAAPSFIVVESRSLPELLGLDAATSERLDRLVPIVSVPSGGLNRRDDQVCLAGAPKQVWGDVIDGIGACHGVVLHAFQRRLVKRRSKLGVSALQADLDRDFAEFCKRAANVTCACPGDAPDTLVHPFALAYTALRAAIRLKVLTGTERQAFAPWREFKRCLAERPRLATAADILVAVAARPDVLNVDGLESQAGKDELRLVPAFIKSLSGGGRELWVTTEQKKQTFDWPAFSTLPDYEEWYRGKAEKDRAGGKRRLGGWKDARVLRFRLP